MLLGIVSVLAAAALMAVDQLLKAWATAVLMPVGSMPLIPHVVELYYLLNDGMSFSMLSGRRTLLVAVTGCMLVVLAVVLFARKMTALERLSWILVLGGGLGNLIDRVKTGVVVDYLNLLFIRFPVFNFADICITVGVVLLILSILLDFLRDRKHGTDSSGQS
ncbi:MAG: signal peptidase II [Gemmiger sp.]|uniref:signal peptidase II n=1 Tax=Gemmiger sp. TaxID=2049027 RepID=UPI002E75E19E|nr:signal peptidase II [Gemmiger sp.]MEE0800982.1 signal peptidase II [Gemmiger sp.]